MPSMNFQLPPPGPEALYHPLVMTWTELTRLANIRPFLGWTTYPFVTYDDWMRKYTSEYCPVYDRQPGRPEFELHGVINDGPHQGGYVSVDSGVVIMTPTRLRPGQYHHEVEDAEWKHYPDPQNAPRPRKSYGFYRSVVDFGEARGKLWQLFVAMREPMATGDMRPGILIIAREDYAFSIPPGYRPHDVQWTAGCECSSLVKVGDYRIPDNGCLEFRDRIAHGLAKSAGHFEVLAGAGDGIYPIEVVKDSEGNVVCVKVRFDGRGDVNLESSEQRLFAVSNAAGNTKKEASFGVKAEREERRRSAGVLFMVKSLIQDVKNVRSSMKK